MLAMKIITYSCLLFSGFTKKKLKIYKKRFILHNLVEIHHIIPRQHKNHPVVLNTNYDLEDGYNLMFLPTEKGKLNLKLHTSRPIHQNGHCKYNIFINNYLDYLYINNNYSQIDIIILNRYLRKNLRSLNIPWN